MPPKIENTTVPLVDAVLNAGITFVTGVPDSEFRSLISQLEERVLGDQYVLATREDNAVAIAAGAMLAGEQSLVFMESSGFGNAIDALTSLVAVYEIPLVLLIAWAGFEGRDVPHHNAIGRPLVPIIEALGFPIRMLLDLGGDVEDLSIAVRDAIEMARSARTAAVVLGVPHKFAGGEVQ